MRNYKQLSQRTHFGHGSKNGTTKMRAPILRTAKRTPTQIHKINHSLHTRTSTKNNKPHNQTQPNTTKHTQARVQKYINPQERRNAQAKRGKGGGGQAPASKNATTNRVFTTPKEKKAPRSTTTNEAHPPVGKAKKTAHFLFKSANKKH